MGARLLAMAVLSVATIAPAAAQTTRMDRLAQRAAPQRQEPAKTQPAAPVPYRTETLTFDHWNVTCRDFHEGQRKHVCSADLKVGKAGSNQVLLDWVIGLDEKGAPVSVMQTLTGVALEPGVQLHLGKSVRKMPYADCFPTHCMALIPIDAKFVHDATTATSAQVVIQAPDGSEVKIDFPTTGFDKAYEALRH